MRNSPAPAELPLVRSPARSRGGSHTQTPGPWPSLSPAPARCAAHHAAAALPLPQQHFGGEGQLGDDGRGALQRGPPGQPAGPGAAGALGAGVVPAAPAAFGLLRASVLPDGHRLAGQIPREPLRARRLRAKPEPVGTGARVGQLAVPSLRLLHVLLWARLDAAAPGHGPGVLAVLGAPLFLPTAHHPAPRRARGSGRGRLLPGFLRAALRGLREVRAVLSWHLVLHPDGARGALNVGAGLLRALRQPHGAAGPRHRAVQLERHAQPLRDAPAAAAAPALRHSGPRGAGRRREGGGRAAPGGAGPPAAAGAHDRALHSVLPAFNSESVRAAAAGAVEGGRPRVQEEGWSVVGAAQQELRAPWARTVCCGAPEISFPPQPRGHGTAFVEPEQGRERPSLMVSS